MPFDRKMKPEKLMIHFQELSERLGIQIINGKGDFSGGTCRIQEDKVVVLNRQKPIEQRLMVLARSFSRVDLKGIYLVPALRAFIDEHDRDPITGDKPDPERINGHTYQIRLLMNDG